MPNKKPKADAESPGVAIKAIAKELEGMKNLLALYLIKSGATQEEIGIALGIAQNTVSLRFPSKRIKRFEHLKRGKGGSHDE